MTEEQIAAAQAKATEHRARSTGRAYRLTKNNKRYVVAEVNAGRSYTVTDEGVAHTVLAHSCDHALTEYLKR